MPSAVHHAETTPAAFSSHIALVCLALAMVPLQLWIAVAGDTAPLAPAAWTCLSGGNSRFGDRWLFIGHWYPVRFGHGIGIRVARAIFPDANIV